MHGDGVLITKGGKTYEGKFLNGKKHGRGLFKCPCCDIAYEGDWLYDQPEGHGTYTWASGNKYTGEWKSGNMHGYGTYEYNCGCKHKGYFKSDKKYGVGTYYFCKGRGQRVGYWENDKRQYWMDEKPGEDNNDYSN